MKPKCFYLLFFLSIFSCDLIYGQSGLPYYKIPENNTWIFGVGAGLDFNTSPPAAVASNNQESTMGPGQGSGTAAISDNTGQLKFYAQMDTVFDKAGNIMPNGGGLIASPPTIVDTTSSYFDGASLIVPFPGEPDKYFVFSKTSIATSSSIASLSGTYGGSDPMAGRLYYSLVDMTLNGGLGDVVAGQKGIQIDSMLSDRLVATKGSGCNIWVLAMKNDGSAIHAFEVSSAGVNVMPVISPCAVTFGTGVSLTPLFRMPGGCMRVSVNDSAQLAVSLAGLTVDPVTSSFYGGHFQLYNFNRVTGIASDQLNIVEPSTLLGLDQQISNLSFSPDNQYLYTPHGLLVGAGLAQFGVTSGIAANIITSKTELNPTFDIGALTGIRLASDDKIYLAGTSFLGLMPSNTLHRIDNPNVAGLGATLTLNALTLTPGAISAWGLGNATVEAPVVDTIFNSQQLALCAPQTSMSLSVPGGSVYTYLWDNGSTADTRTITAAGTYWVIYGTNCPRRIDSFIVEAVDLRFNLGNDTVICGTVFPFKLQAPEVPGANYLWQDGSTAPDFQVTTNGDYSVTISKSGCTAADTVRVDVYDVFQDLGRDTVVCAKTPFSIRLEARVPQGASALWSTGAITPEIYVSAPGSYGVRVDQNICVGIDTIRIGTELCDCISFMPTAFSPNGDGLNDIFVPQLEADCAVHGYRFNVFNRWGEMVFSTEKPGRGWDGTYKGKEVDAGTYMFTISLEKGTHYNTYALKGDVTLVR